METFDANWLALREPVDDRSRAEALLAPLCQAWRARGWTRVLDLGSGRGANLRYLAPRLPAGQRWVLVDHDPTHLDQLARLVAPRSVSRLTVMRGNIADEGLAAVTDTDVVTASAMLDLVSEEWLTELVGRCAETGRGAYFALSYDGEIHWSRRDGRGAADTDPDDALVRSAVNAHQLGDKGLGPAMGPAAARVAERLFREAGYRTQLLRSPWHVGVAETPLVHQLVDGWAVAAAEARPDETGRVQGWADRRRAAVAGGRVQLTVGHRDLLALADRL